jgi:hypothetical protein
MYHNFVLDLETKIQSFTEVIGEMADYEQGMRLKDAVNMMTKIELSISKFKLRPKLYTFKHKIRDATTDQWLSSHLSVSSPTKQIFQVAIRSIQINSNNDYNSS